MSLDVFIDGQLVGQASRRRPGTFSVPPGEHFVLVRLGNDDEWSASLQLCLEPDERIALTARSNQPALHPWHVRAFLFLMLVCGLSKLAEFIPALRSFEKYVVLEFLIALGLGFIGLLIHFRRAYQAGAFGGTVVYLAVKSATRAEMAAQGSTTGA